MLVNEPFNEKSIKNGMMEEFYHKVTDKIYTDPAYCTLLLNSQPLHDKLLITLDDAIKINENEEKYEICATLLTFKNAILNKSKDDESFI